MSATPLHDLWEASASQPFQPTFSKDSQFQIGFTLLFIGLLLTGLFGLSMSQHTSAKRRTNADVETQTTHSRTSPSTVFQHR